MTIEIDKENRIRVHSDHYALMKPVTRKGEIEWKEYEWHTKLPSAIHSLTQKRLSQSDELVNTKEFLQGYKNTYQILTSITDVESR